MNIPNLEYLLKYKGNIVFYLKKNYLDFYNHLSVNYLNVENYREKLYLFFNNLSEPKKCVTCGSKSIFYSLRKGYSNYCSRKCSDNSNIRLDCIKNTKLKRYNNENYCNTDKIKETKLKRYNNEKYVNLEKRKLTNIEKYGNKNYVETEEFKEKSKQTCIERYGVDSYTKTEEFKDIISFNKDTIQEKIYNTKKKNNTFNSSKVEIQFEDYLKENNINYKKQYKSELYPFFCDFYLPDSDLYLEINAHWTHGGHPFDSTNNEDQLQLESWKQKGTKFYDNAIETWTKRDVLKRETAKKNNLNYLEVFTESLDKIIKKIKII